MTDATRDRHRDRIYNDVIESRHEQILEVICRLTTFCLAERRGFKETSSKGSSVDTCSVVS